MNERKLAENCERATTRVGEEVILRCLENGVRVCFGNAEAPDRCFAPEPKPPEFREGDWVAGQRPGTLFPINRIYFQVMRGITETGFVEVNDAAGHFYYFKPQELTPIDRDSSTPPTGPIRVGCCVQLILTKHLGIVAKESVSMPGHFLMYGFEGWWPKTQLRLIASPDNHEQ